MSVFEIVMLVCFGAAWPASIYKSYTSGSNEGKSLIFLVIVLAGYMAGIIHKLRFSPDFVILLYGLNALLVALDILLYVRNSAYRKKPAL